MSKEKTKVNKPLFTFEFFRVLLLHFFAMASYGIYFFLPRFIRLTGGEEFLIGLIMGAPAAAAIVFRLPTGAWVDRLGRRRMVVTGLLFFAVTSALPIFASGAGLYLFLVRAAAGAAMVMYFTAIVTYVAEKAPAGRRAEAIALYGAGGFIAQAISPFLCEWLLEALPLEPINRFRVLFALAALFAFFASLFSLTMSEDEHHPEKHLDPDPWYRVLRSPTMIYLLLPSIVFGTAFSSMFSFITDFTEVHDLGAPSSFFVSYSLTVIILRLTTGRLLDRIDRRLVVVASLAVISLGLYYASISAGRADLILVGILTGTGHSYIFPSLTTLAYDSSQARNRGTSMALYMLGFDLSTMGMSPVLGQIAQNWDYMAMYRVVSVFLLLGMLVYISGWRYHAPHAIRRSAGRAHPEDEFAKNTGVLR